MPSNKHLRSPETLVRCRAVSRVNHIEKARHLWSLARRFDHLDDKVRRNKDSPAAMHYDRAERMALAWAILELAAEWPGAFGMEPTDEIDGNVPL